MDTSHDSMPRLRALFLRADALFLVPAALGGLAMDIAGAFFHRGPEHLVLREVPEAALGFTEAHGLALVLGSILLFAPPRRLFHLAGGAAHVVLGASNLVFWQMFVTGKVLGMGYLTTLLHVFFAGLQLFGAWIAWRGKEGHDEERAPSAEERAPSAEERAAGMAGTAKEDDDMLATLPLEDLRDLPLPRLRDQRAG